MYQNKIIDGKQLATKLLNSVRKQVLQYVDTDKYRPPTLAVILVGENPASMVYVRNKKNTCNSVGINSIEYNLDSKISETELLSILDNLNQDDSVDGILLQLPLPNHINSKLVIDHIVPTKDVDGFSRYNMGSLAINNPEICPCTPHGIMFMLDDLNLNYHGKHAVIIGSSNIVGRPMAIELLNRGATVTICNSKTLNLPTITALADILIVAIGKAQIIKSDWVKENSIIIDVGINRLHDGTICGDVDFQDVINKVSLITPVPGGVGPMTIAMLMQNTLLCYERNLSST